ncbi:glycosyltransferase [Onishia niordana]|uniref:glycosyltransferase n=1 Tax=Onishia niordana TaxID=2508711 RepID=UPI001F10617F|nr:glycosyltransferase [Halomonas niordiana]
MSKLPEHISVASRATELTTLLLLLALLVVLISELPADVFSPASKSFFFAIGAVGAWRYSWWAVQALRSVWYNRRVFPRLRAAADAAGAVARPDELYVLCTSYRIDAEVSFRIYEALVSEAADYGVPTTIFAAVSDQTDVDVITHVMEASGRPANVEIRYMFQKGDGKRSAMAEVLRAISRRMPSSNALLVSMDGDILLEPGTLERSLSFFLSRDDLGALTTNNSGIVIGNDATREWYDLRYAQRHLMMSSMSVSQRLLVLTGRYSAFRADLATHPEFIALVEHDQVDHWRFGRFKFLSGDDKSTWFWLLKHGWKMLYLPDVFVSGFEELPDRRRFFASTIDLMRRWYGNMLRTSGRAIALGPRPMGLFTWWSLIDQRLSMWTTLIGPSVAILVSLFWRPSFLFAYLLWIFFTRGIASLVLAWQRGRFSLLWIPLLYYNQVFGALLKTYVSFRFNRQAWSRQGISAGEPSDPVAARRQRRMGHVLHAFFVGVMLYVLTVAAGVLQPPDPTALQILSEEYQQAPSTDREFTEAELPIKAVGNSSKHERTQP